MNKAYLWALFVTSGLVLSPRLGEGGLLNFLRIDDIFFPITFIFFIILLTEQYTKNSQLIKFVLPFIIWTMFCLASLMLSHSAGFDRIGLLEKSLPALKSFQYTIYFGFFWMVAASRRSNKSVMDFFFHIYLCFFPNTVFAMFQVVTLRFTGFYGLEIINEFGAILTGVVYFIAAVLCTCCVTLESNTISKIFWFYLTLLHILFTILTGSRGALGALFIYFIIRLTMLLAQGGKLLDNRTRNTFLMVGILLLAALLFISTNPLYANQIDALIDKLPLRSVNHMESGVGGDARYDNWLARLGDVSAIFNINPFLLFIGLGSGAFYEIYGELTNAADSQYLYVFLSGGLIGTILYAYSFGHLYVTGIGALVKSSYKSLLPVFHGLFWSFMVFGITQEVFHLSKPGGLFWIVCGLVLGSASTEFNQDNVRQK